MKLIFNVVCIGCGGTGSIFIKEFARFMSSFCDSNKAISLTLVDGDIVEVSNLERQAFIMQDLNLNKATVMAAAIRDNFGLSNISAFPQYIERLDQLKQIFLGQRIGCGDDKQIDILIGCVDNHRARQVMHQYFDTHNKTLFYFDSANGFGDGEVVFSGKHNKKILGHPRGYFFPAVLTDTSPGAAEISCTEINEREPQHIVTNMLAANTLLSGLAELITDNRMDFGIVFFNALKKWMVFRPDMEA